MKLKAKLITAALVLLGTIVLSGCDYQINPRRGPYGYDNNFIPYAPGYPYNPNYNDNFSDARDFKASITAQPIWGYGNDSFMYKEDFCLYHNKEYICSEVTPRQYKGIAQVNLHPKSATDNNSDIILFIDLRYVWKNPAVIYIHDKQISPTPLVFFGHQ